MASAAATDTTGGRRNVVGTSTVGDGPKALVAGAKTLRFVFHNFKGMKQNRGECVLSPPPLEAFGYLWRLEFYPKGRVDSDTDTEHISVYLKYVGDKKNTPSAKFKFRCKKYITFRDNFFPHGYDVWTTKFFGTYGCSKKVFGEGWIVDY